MWRIVSGDRFPQGHLSLNDLIENSSAQGATEREWHACCDDDVASCNLWGADISPDDIQNPDSERPKIILYDRPGDHMLVLANGLAMREDGVKQEAASLLLSNGWIYHWSGDSPVYAAWAERHSKGIGEPFPPGLEDRIREQWQRHNRVHGQQ